MRYCRNQTFDTVKMELDILGEHLKIHFDMEGESRVRKSIKVVKKRDLFNIYIAVTLE